MERRIFATKIDAIEKYYFFMGLEPTLDELDYEKDVHGKYFAFETDDDYYYVIDEEHLTSLDPTKGAPVTMIDIAIVTEETD